ncbi:MAG: hypothetical protein AB7U18_19125, partial [Dehalococcoidia bacterium]
ALDPRPGALPDWQARYGATPEDRPARQAKRGRDSNYRRGIRAEQWVRNRLKREGYWMPANVGSLGAADIVAIRASGDGPAVRAIQVKMLDTFEPSGLNDAVRDLLNLGVRGRRRLHAIPTTAQREAWLLIDIGNDDYEQAACCVLNVDGAPTVTGARAEEVQRSLDRMLARGEPSSHTERLSLRERLGVES